MLNDRVRRHYENQDESQRLWRSARGELARLRTWDVFARFLPAGSVVADVGGGPGVHAFHLAQSGHAVTLIEPVQHHVDQAAASGLVAVLGDARELPLPDGSVDAVLLMGPLYHLIEPGERLAALSEAGRVLRPGGLLLAEVITRQAWLLEATTDGRLDEPGMWDSFERNLETGLSQDPADPPDGSFWAYFHRVEELPAEVEAAGFVVEQLIAVEGYGGVLGDLQQRLVDPEPLLRVLRMVESEPSMLGASGHVMAIARKPSA